MKFSKLFCYVAYSLFILCCLSACVSTQDKNANESKAIANDMIAMSPTEKATLADTKVETTTDNEPNKTSEKMKESELSQNLMDKFLAQQKLNKQQLTPETLSLYQQAIKAVKNKQWQQAQALLQQVLIKSPNLSGAYYYQAVIAYNKQTFEEAKLLIAKSILINNNNPYSFNLQAVIARKLGDFTLAENSYEKAITIWPDYSEAHLNYAVFLELYRGQLEEAKKHYLQYLMLKPDDKKVARWLAGLELKLASKEVVNEANI